MDRMEELYNLICSFKCDKQEEILDAIGFLNQPIEDYVMLDSFKCKNLKDDHLKTDIFCGKYKGKSMNDYENQRKKAKETICKTENIKDQISIALRESAEIREGIHGINYNEILKPCFQVEFMMETCRNMLLQGATLTEISKYVPGSQLGDIYHFSIDYLGIEVEPSEEEMAEIMKYDNEQKNGTNNTVNLAAIMKQMCMKGIPQKRSDNSGWSIDDGVAYDTLEMACMYAGCSLSFPYYYEDKKNPSYAKTFDIVLEKVMLHPEKVNLDGLEGAYSAQEWNLLKKLQKKLLDKIKDM